MLFTYLSTRVVRNRVIHEYQNPNQILDEVKQEKIYILVLHKAQHLFIDLTKMMRTLPNIDFTLTVIAFLNTRLNALTILGYTANEAMPMIDIETGRYLHRVDAFNANAEVGMEIGYTAMHTPEYINDLHLKHRLLDLAISSDRRELDNCMVTVNGVFHSVSHFQDKLYVKDGFFNIMNCGRSDVNMYDTASVGGHTAVPILPDNLVNSDEQDIRQSAYIRFPDHDFSNSTVLVVIDGHLLSFNDTYRIVSKNMIKINFHKLDIINTFLHNPNTQYMHDYVRDEPDEDADEPPFTFDMIKYWIENVWPYPGMDKDANRAAMHLFYYMSRYSKYPKVRDLIRYYFESVYPELLNEFDTSMIAQMDPSPLAMAINDITKQMEYAKFTSEQFTKNRLFSPHSFIAIVHNPYLYMRKYTLQPTVEPDQYVMRSKDMPRGMLRYNEHLTMPFMQYSSPNHQHNVTLTHHHGHADIYKTILNPLYVPSPMFDLNSTEMTRTAELVELYAP